MFVSLRRRSMIASSDIMVALVVVAVAIITMSMVRGTTNMSVESTGMDIAVSTE